MTISETGTCCLCGGQYERFGNNPWPASNIDYGERCCHECNSNKVIPMRLLLWAMGNKDKEPDQTEDKK